MLKLHYLKNCGGNKFIFDAINEVQSETLHRLTFVYHYFTISISVGKIDRL